MSSNTGSTRLSKFYSLFPWPEDPYSEPGRKRYEDALKDMEALISSRMLQNLVEKKTVKILEACGGTGIGGVALSKVLMSKKCLRRPACYRSPRGSLGDCGEVWLRGDRLES
ncbi:MAG: hypothetical protein QW797_05055 [Thermoproteota archaeon]